SLPSRSALIAASISKVGLVMGHLFSVNGKEMTQNSEHYRAVAALSLLRIKPTKLSAAERGVMHQRIR
ncbi:hypothetical protein, partial [Microbulbifer aggregans]|uniref:hypothetical protein n=1 Tax=Microbulbifer aggregans TaxID=1769779 RepID=UPI001CFC52D0